jgi:hypothetical protein
MILDGKYPGTPKFATLERFSKLRSRYHTKGEA